MRSYSAPLAPECNMTSSPLILERKSLSILSVHSVAQETVSIRNMYVFHSCKYHGHILLSTEDMLCHGPCCPMYKSRETFGQREPPSQSHGLL